MSLQKVSLEILSGSKKERIEEDIKISVAPEDIRVIEKGGRCSIMMGCMTLNMPFEFCATIHKKAEEAIKKSEEKK